eukprot:SM000204S05850  [mRNA]  locus=s204:15690:17005:- [translate_table: standard]
MRGAPGSPTPPAPPPPLLRLKAVSAAAHLAASADLAASAGPLAAAAPRHGPIPPFSEGLGEAAESKAAATTGNDADDDDDDLAVGNLVSPPAAEAKPAAGCEMGGGNGDSHGKVSKSESTSGSEAAKDDAAAKANGDPMSDMRTTTGVGASERQATMKDMLMGIMLIHSQNSTLMRSVEGITRRLDVLETRSGADGQEPCVDVNSDVFQSGAENSDLIETLELAVDRPQQQQQMMCGRWERPDNNGTGFERFSSSRSSGVSAISRFGYNNRTELWATVFSSLVSSILDFIKQKANFESMFYDTREIYSY